MIFQNILFLIKVSTPVLPLHNNKLYKLKQKIQMKVKDFNLRFFCFFIKK
jgi:hypothetical protein